MGFVKLGKTASAGESVVNGRQYFAQAAKELGIAGLDPVAVRKTEKRSELKTGRRESRKGGSLAHRNIRHLSPEETAERRRRSERFLTQPDTKFPAEER
jgi:hypothetical protein